MTEQEHLQAIKTKCQALLAIAEKRTAGEWRILDADDECPGIEAGKTSIVIWGGEDDEAGVRTGINDATFIASCAGAAEAGWWATIAAIDVIELLEAHNGPLATTIIAAWPEELLS
jgi:hypothetical protein